MPFFTNNSTKYVYLKFHILYFDIIKKFATFYYFDEKLNLDKTNLSLILTATVVKCVSLRHTRGSIVFATRGIQAKYIRKLI